VSLIANRPAVTACLNTPLLLREICCCTLQERNSLSHSGGLSAVEGSYRPDDLFRHGTVPSAMLCQIEALERSQPNCLMQHGCTTLCGRRVLPPTQSLSHQSLAHGAGSEATVCRSAPPNQHGCGLVRRASLTDAASVTGKSALPTTLLRTNHVDIWADVAHRLPSLR
jgi:hypothetical protein